MFVVYFILFMNYMLMLASSSCVFALISPLFCVLIDFILLSFCSFFYYRSYTTETKFIFNY